MAFPFRLGEKDKARLHCGAWPCWVLMALADHEVKRVFHQTQFPETGVAGLAIARESEDDVVCDFDADDLTGLDQQFSRGDVVA